MRPTKLTVQGLTAYREPIEVDFTGLDLFAITGPTGAGKSSLVDAITYALYGQVPRVGRSVRELISQGEERLKVSLEFTVDDGRYRIFRESGRKTQKPPQLERFDPEVNDWRSEDVERVKDTNEFVERLLRMDYEAFIRSVLLPQGEFQEFLAGDRDERRKVLDGLLRLGVYAQMQKAANAIAARETDRADEIARRLLSEMADATPEALKAAKADLKTLDADAKTATAARETLDTACRTAEALGEAQAKQRRAAEALTDAEKRLASAQEAARGGEERAAALKATVADVQGRVEKTLYNEAEYLRYRDANAVAVELNKDEATLAETEKQGAGLEAQVKAAMVDADAALAAHEAAVVASQQAAEALEEARRSNAAEALRQKMKPGDPCPVCGQPLHDIAHEKVPKLDDAKVAAERAKGAESASAKAAEAARTRLTQLQGRLESYVENHKRAEQRVTDRRAAIVAALGGKAEPPKEIAAALVRLEAARVEREKLTKELEASTKALAEVTASMATATADLGRLQGEAEACTREVKEAGAVAAQTEASVRETAKAAAWDDVLRAIEGGKDAAALLRGRLAEAQRREAEFNQAIGAGRTRTAHIEASIEKAKDLREEEKSRREEASLARDLASLLKTDAFPTFLREKALKGLAREGSEQLFKISSGRYNFVVDGQDFLVKDLWNAEAERSVKTLSGGETFLASLALALALAEQLPALSGDGTVGALESLFIDEGFSHLDDETLNDVASALEVLGADRSRLIGVITHVAALAERMPARITVHKTQSGSSVTVD